MLNVKKKNDFLKINNRVWIGPGTFLTRHDDQLPSLSGVHGLKDFLRSAHLLESFDGRIYSLSVVRGVDRRALLKMFRGQITI